MKVGRVIPNAPLRPPERQRLFHTPPPWVKAGTVFFITVNCVPRGENQLANERVFPVLRDAFLHNVATGNLWLHLLVAMPDHLHTLLSFPPDERMEGVIRNLKRFVAKSAGVRWQDGFFDHRLRSHENFEEKAAYIRMNPVRAQLVGAIDKWPYLCPALDPQPAR